MFFYKNDIIYINQIVRI